ncbi:MAG: FxLYD domain-containing protein [Anaerolineales bacterium]
MSVISNTVLYVDTANYLNVIGEVANTTARPVGFVIVTVTFYDGGHQFLTTDYTYLYLEHLPSGDRTCFHLRLSEPAGWTSYEFAAPTYTSSDQGPPNLALLAPAGAYRADTHKYTLSGQARNDEGGTVAGAQAVGTLYNAAGAPVGCDYAGVDSNDLAPGQTSAFSMPFGARDFADVASWRLQLDGDPR